uniref:Irregular chiasm C roughest protein n=1 Tax=Echinococcus granulosus TaxID=6210 RepID=A0A068WW46_ECHGR|nr:irregular chiasm C roughest protein [Echinococcus granulosus]
MLSGKAIPNRGGTTETEEEEEEEEASEAKDGLSRLRLGPREREISTAAFLDLHMTAELHRQLLRCYTSPVTATAGVFMDSPTWKHTSLLLSVSYGPKLQGPEEEVEAVTTGQSAQLTCQVEANPPAKVTWYHYRGIKVVNKAALGSHPNASGLFTATVITHRLLRSFLTTDLDSRDFRKLISEERYSALNVKAHSIDSFGFYICVGLAAQREVRKIVVLAESGPPQIDTPTRVSGRVGGRGRIACHTIALPKPTPHEFFWTHASTHASVVPSSSLHIEHEEKLTGSTSAIVFSKIAKEHFGHYNCTVNTAHGSDSIVIVFTEIHELSYTLVIGVGVSIVVVLLFAAMILWTLRHRLLQLRGGETARIITANQAARQSVDMLCRQTSTLGRQSLKEECSEIQRGSVCVSQTTPLQAYSSLLRSPCRVITCENGALYKCVTAASTPTTPLLTRLWEPPSSPPTIYVATATDVISTGEVVGNSRVALLTKCSANCQDHFFPT